MPPPLGVHEEAQLLSDEHWKTCIVRGEPSFDLALELQQLGEGRRRGRENEGGGAGSGQPEWISVHCVFRPHERIPSWAARPVPTSAPVSRVDAVQRIFVADARGPMDAVGSQKRLGFPKPPGDTGASRIPEISVPVGRVVFDLGSVPVVAGHARLARQKLLDTLRRRRKIQVMLRLRGWLECSGSLRFGADAEHDGEEERAQQPN
jgi:hypothetical protein